MEFSCFLTVGETLSRDPSRLAVCLLVFLASATPRAIGAPVDGESERPNVLFIVADDWNDWNSVLDGYPKPHPPNLDRLAARSVTFSQAYCSSPVCNPSRTAVMFGRRASSTGVYNNEQFMRDAPVLAGADTIPQVFMKQGYRSLTAGKIFHWYKNSASDPQSWHEQFAYDFWSPRPENRDHEVVPAIRWGPLDIPDDAMPDMQVARWSAEKLQDDYPDGFFLAAGIFRPHGPWYVPRRYFDLYPLGDIVLPEVNPADLEDVPPVARNIALENKRRFTDILRHGAWREGVQAYLASISFADACLGRILDALDRSPHADNTLVVFWTDHGWHLGEKLTWTKWKLWEESIRSNLMISVPGNPHNGSRSERPVSLLDIYPTLIELADLPEKSALDGRSLVPLLEDPNAEWRYPVLINRDLGQHAVRSERFNYIRYENGSEELYDHQIDPMEWTNLADDPVYAEIKERLRQHLPESEHPHIKEDFDSHL